MNPRALAIFKLLAVFFVLVLLVLLFRPAMSFVEMAARELVYFWWLVLLLLLAAWLIWGLGCKKK
jgi:hypothetical protein